MAKAGGILRSLNNWNGPGRRDIEVFDIMSFRHPVVKVFGAPFRSLFFFKR
jgi:hypothetical protein